jgi:hypothetical protein
MYNIFLKIEEERERVKQDFENKKCGRSGHSVDEVTSQYFYKLNTLLTTAGDELKEFYKTDKHMLLGGEFRQHVWELERLYNRYKDIPYTLPLMKRVWIELEEFLKDLKILRKRINVFSYCSICYEPYNICREKDKDKCQFLESDERYKLHEPKFTETCSGCEYVSVDVKHHIKTGGCLKDKIKPEDIEIKDIQLRADVNPEGSFWKYKKVKSDAEIEAESIAIEKREKEAKKKEEDENNASSSVVTSMLPKPVGGLKGFDIRPVVTLRKKWVCGYCKKGPGSNDWGADHRTCVFEGFDCDVRAWENARYIK